MSSDSEFGNVVTAMVTPFTAEGKLDLEGAWSLARRLTEEGRNDGLVVSGTTGESATTSDAEKTDLLRSVVDAVNGRARVIAGVGANDTRHGVELARQAETAGADALLVVSPYYSKPSQEGVLHHFMTIADATSLPVMLYDIPQRTGVAIESATMVRAGEHDRIRAVKDAKGDLVTSSWVISRSDLSFYSGEDALNLPLLSVGAAGYISVAGHLVPEDLRGMLVAYRSGDVQEALRIHQRLLPIYEGIFRAPAAALVKAALQALGLLAARAVRPPLVETSESERTTLLEDMKTVGIHPTKVGE